MQFLANCATAVGGVIVVVGLLFALRELRALANAQRFVGAQEFFQLLDDTQSAREYVYQELPQSPEGLRSLTRDEIKRAERAVNALNRIAYLLDHDLVPRDIVFRMTHTMIIRLVFCLGPFIAWREEVLGSRWGRRVLDLGRRARRYHEINPRHAGLRVCLDRAGASVVIFEPAGAAGPTSASERALRRTAWLLRRY